jgi:pimeloyl-ACP methyl ester carboxylesterase
MFTEYTEADFVDHGLAELADRVDPEWWAKLRLADPLAVHRSAVGLARGAGVTVATMLARVRTPCTFLRGGLDGPKPGAAELAAAGVRLVEVPGAGHNIMLDAPEAFARATAEAFGVA